MIARFKKNIGKLVSVVLIIAMAFQSIAAPVSFAGPAAAEPAKVTGTWSQDAAGNWSFRSQDGAAKDGWYYLNTGNHSAEYNWFCFDANGVMRTGWVPDKNDPSVWYYTGESKDGSEGGLVKGWITDPQDGKKYYLDPSTGIMCHGWKQISGVWYYFGESRYADRRWGQDSSGYWTDGKSGKHTYGALYMNEYTPDGYYVGANGAWVQNHSEDDHSDKPDPIPAYGIIVEADGHGTAKAQVGGADVTSAAPGAAVTLIATANDGYAFKSWQIERGLDSITGNSFTMPSKEVKVKAIFERVYNINLQTNEHGTVSATVDGETVTTAAENAEVTLTATPDEGYQFKEWNVVSGGITVKDDKFTMPAGNVTIQAVFEAKTPLPAGALKGEFSVSATKKVHFSQGNLVATIDATGAPTAWKFAANQYGYIGSNVANTSIGNTAGDIDLFGWSTDAASNNWGIHTKTSATNKFTTGNFKDWGKAVGDGMTWRTLSKNEWSYLINTNDDENIRKGKYKYGVTVCEKANCLILAPDDFEGTIAESYDAAAWAEAEAAGLVCLPAAGDRAGFNVLLVGTYGFYWSSTKSGSEDEEAYDLRFTGSEVNPGGRREKRCIGCSVRLVTEVKAPAAYTVTFASAEHGAIYDAATSGKKVTEISVASGTTVAVNNNKITIGDTDYYAVADSGYKFKEFSGSVPETITAATTITPVFEAIPETKKLSEILPSGFPDSAGTAWVNGDGKKAYKDGDNIKVGNLTLGKDTTVTKSGDTYVCNSGDATVTFNVKDGVAESITVTDSGDSDGTYTAPAASVTYMDWDDSEKELVEKSIPADAIEVTNATTSLDDGKFYVVKGADVQTGTLTVNGTATLILMDGAKLTVTGSADNAGIYVISGKALIITGQKNGTGVLFATGGTGGAGIGSEFLEKGGTVTINGGTVTAIGKDSGAGIGGGTSGSGGTVTINGGTVTATGANGGAGIGGGTSGSGGTVTINGGTVTATGGDIYGTTGAAIGNGSYSSSSGNVTFGEGVNFTIYAGADKDNTESKTTAQYSEDHSAAYVSIEEVKTGDSIAFDENPFEPGNIKAGQTLTIKGKKLDLVTKVIFCNDVEVTNFKSQSSEQIVIEKFPATARTGKVTLVNGTTSQEVTSDMDLVVAQPSVSEIYQFTGVTPYQKLTINGENFDLVVDAIIGDDTYLDYIVSNEGHTIEITMPDEVHDDTVKVIAYSGVEVTVATVTTSTPATTHTVTFNLNGATGTAPVSQSIASGSKATKPDDPTFTDHTFAGWYKTKDATTGALPDPWDFDTDTVTEDMTLYAQWTRNISTIVSTNDNVPTWPADEEFDWEHPDLQNIPNDAWVAAGGQKAFWVPGEEGGFAMLYINKISDDETKILVFGTDDTDVFIKVGDKYICTNDFGTFTCTTNAGVFTSLTFEGNDLTEYGKPDFSLLNGTYAPAKTFKAVYDKTGDANTLTFYYDNKDHSGENITVYEGSSGDNYLFDNSKSNGAKWGYNGNRSNIKSVIIDASVADYKGLTSTTSMFQGMTTATNISGAEYLDVSNVTDMSYMFQNFGGGKNGSPTTLNVVPDVSKWNTGNVTNMTAMFESYGNFSSSLEKVPDVSDWNTGNVTDMTFMFQKYGHESQNFNAVPDVSGWNTGNVTNMQQMFKEYGYKSTALDTVPDVSKWNTGNVTNMSSMFNGYGDASTNISCVLDLSGWDLSKITGTNGEKVFNFKPKTFSVTIPAKTGEKSNEGEKWYYGDGTNSIAPPEGKKFTPAKEMTVADVLETAAGGFSNSDWIYESYSCFNQYSHWLSIAYNDENTYGLTNLTDKVTLEDDNWTCTTIDEKGKVTFNMTDEALTSITISGTEVNDGKLNGEYVPQAKQTVAGVLPDNFPTSKDAGWKNEHDYSMFKDGSNLVIYTDGGDPVDTVPLETVLTKNDGELNCYSSNGLFTFNMNGDNLGSIEYLYYGWDDYNDADGTYTAPAAPEIKYMAWDETNKQLVEKSTSDYTEVTGSTTTLSGGKFYIVKGADVQTGTLTVNGTATLILMDGAKLTATGGEMQNAGINVASGKTLVITGQKNGTGILVANGNSATGIGGGSELSGGAVTINGGTVTANGGQECAGIGGGSGCSGGTVTINGGTVTANGGPAGAGIGGGYGYGGNGGTVTINGGMVTATGASGGAGIGGGMEGNGGTVTINGGTVTATGSDDGYGAAGAAIGKGAYCSSSGTLAFAEGVNFTIKAGADKDNTESKTTAEYSADHSAAYVSIEESAAPPSKLLNSSGTSSDPVNDAPMAETEVSEPTAEVFEPEFEPEKFEEAKPEELIEPAEAVAEEAAP